MTTAAASPLSTRVTGTALVAVAVIASMLALRTVVLPPWAGAGVVAVLLVAVVVSAVRALLAARSPRGARTWPTVAGLVTALWFLLARFGGPGGTPDWLVGTSSFATLRDQLDRAAVILRDEVAPVPGTAPMALLCIGGALLVLLAADAAAAADHPLVAAGLVLVLWFPPLVLTSTIPWPTFTVVVAALLGGLALTGAPTPRRHVPDPVARSRVRRAQQRRALRTTATAVVVAVVALTVSSAAGGSGGPWTRLFLTDTTHSGALTDDLDMYQSLRQRSDVVVLQYTTSSGNDVGPLRLATLTSFDGRRWAPERPGGSPRSEDDLLFPSPAAPVPEPEHLDVTIRAMAEQRLPLATEPRTVSSDTAWQYDEARDQVVRATPTRPDETYAMTVHPRALTAEVLRAAPPGFGEVDASYLEVPATEHAADIAALAQEVVGDAASDLDRAAALQSYLRNPLTFTYDAQVPAGATGDAVWDFLVHRQGYCVQFATAMVVTSRTLGIPARLAVGYLPGEKTASGAWTVTGLDSHAWPELYFSGVGWVRFEPTPAVQTGLPPAHTTALASGSPRGATAPPGNEVPVPAASAPAPTTLATDIGLVPAGDAGEPASMWWLVASVVVLTALAIVGTALARRRDRTPLDAEDAWTRVVGALAAAGIVLPRSTTPRQAAQEAAAAWSVRRRTELPREAREGIVALAREVELERYAPTGAGALDTGRTERLTRLTRQVTSGLAGAGKSVPRP